jgi:hypothetical protein
MVRATSDGLGSRHSQQVDQSQGLRSTPLASRGGWSTRRHRRSDSLVPARQVDSADRLAILTNLAVAIEVGWDSKPSRPRLALRFSTDIHLTIIKGLGCRVDGS